MYQALTISSLVFLANAVATSGSSAWNSRPEQTAQKHKSLSTNNIGDDDRHYIPPDDDDDYYIEHGQWILDRTIDSTDPDSWSPTGTTQIVSLSPDGLTLANGYTLTDQSFDVQGFKVMTYTYVDRLQNWIPLDDENAIRMDSTGPHDAFRMDMGINTLVASRIDVQQYYYSEDSPTYKVDSEIRLWILTETHTQGKTAVFWKQAKPLLINDGNDNEKEFFGASISIHDKARDNMSEEDGRILVAVGIPRSEYYPDSGVGRVQVYSYVRDPTFTRIGQWEKHGSSIQGENYAFGSDVKLSQDGNTLAVLGSYRHKSNTDDYLPLQVCLIRVFRYDAELNEWVQLGQDLRADENDDSFMCDNMALSSDGRTVAAGSRWCNNEEEEKGTVGHVRVWTWNEKEWKRRGPDIDSLVPAMSPGQDFTFGFLLTLSENGDRLVVLVDEGPVPDTMHQRSVAYASTFGWEAGEWAQSEMDLPLVGTTIKDVAMTPNGRLLAIQSEGLREQAFVDTFCWWPQERTRSQQRTKNSKRGNTLWGYKEICSASDRERLQWANLRCTGRT